MHGGLSATPVEAERYALQAGAQSQWSHSLGLRAYCLLFVTLQLCLLELCEWVTRPLVAPQPFCISTEQSCWMEASIFTLKC